MKASDFFALPPSLALFERFFDPTVPPWEWLRQIAPALASITDPPVAPGSLGGVHVEGKVWLHPGVKLPSHATLIGPAWIGPDSEIRPGAYVRGNLIAGGHCVLGNACEFKNALLMDHVAASHFNYVGDSIVGNGAHFGAGVICSNLRLDQQPVIVRAADAVFETGLRKFGAIVGDGAEVGCNAVLNPGTVLGRRALVSPAIAVSGYVPAETIVHARAAVKFVPRRS